jgi:hypothetical protein
LDFVGSAPGNSEVHVAVRIVTAVTIETVFGQQWLEIVIEVSIAKSGTENE